MNVRRAPCFVLRLAALSLAVAMAPRPGGAQHAAHDSTFGSHGMVVFGSRGQFLSHLPLYRAPHDWQMVLRVMLGADSAGADVESLLAADRAATGETLYTLEPESFSHAVMAAHLPFDFQGTLYRGHFERGGTPIARGVRVRVDSVLHRRRLGAGEPHASPGQHLLLRDGDESFLVHIIEGAPDFDQILEARGAELPPAGVLAELGGGPARPHQVGEPVLLQVGDDVAALLVLRQLYLEHGDLAGPE